MVLGVEICSMSLELQLPTNSSYFELNFLGISCSFLCGATRQRFFLVRKICNEFSFLGFEFSIAGSNINVKRDGNCSFNSIK